MLAPERTMSATMRALPLMARPARQLCVNQQAYASAILEAVTGILCVLKRYYKLKALGAQCTARCMR